MTTKPITAPLKLGDKLVQTKYAPTQVLTVFKVDGNHVLLMTEDGNRKFHEALTAERLRDYDYELIKED